MAQWLAQICEILPDLWIISMPKIDLRSLMFFLKSNLFMAVFIAIRRLFVR